MASGRTDLRGGGATAADISRFGMMARKRSELLQGERRLTLEETERISREERVPFKKKVLVCVVALAALSLVSLGLMGSAGGLQYAYVSGYQVFSPLDVCYVIYLHAYDMLGSLTHLWAPHAHSWIVDNAPEYWAVEHRASVVGITLLCAVLLAVSGSLYQAVFKNPIAGPGMLGVGSGVSLGLTLLVSFYGSSASGFLLQRYGFCYGFGAAILVFVILAGKRVSGKGRPYDVVSMLLIGSIVSQLIGFVVSYVTLFVMDQDSYDIYYTLSQMLVVDTSWIAWTFLGAIALASFIPIWRLRFKLNALAFDEREVRLMGVDPMRLRAVALICGAMMVLAAQIHCGAVGMVSLIVPFLSRSWFGCEFRKQLIGNLCIGPILLLGCRDIADLVPFVGDGISIGAVVAIVAMPVFLLIVAKQMRGWE